MRLYDRSDEMHTEADFAYWHVCFARQSGVGRTNPLVRPSRSSRRLCPRQESHWRDSAEGPSLHLVRDFSQPPFGGTKPEIGATFPRAIIRKPIGSSNPLRSASKSMALQEKIP